MKAILAACLAASSAAGFAHAQTSTLQDFTAAMAPLPGMTIYTAKEIVTMDASRPTATAVAVVGERIFAVGTLEGLQRTAGTQPYTVDRTFANKVITPGLIAQHMHPALAALTMKTEIISIEDWVLPTGTIPGVRDRGGYLKRLREAEAKLADPDALLVTWGYHPYFHGTLTRKDLDAISARRPILLWHRSVHEFVLNTPALAKYGLDAAFIAKQAASAQKMMVLADGHFWEQGMFPILPQILPAFATPERLRGGLEFMKTYVHANGITAICDPGAVPVKALQDAQNAVFGGADTPFHDYLIADGKTMGERFGAGDLIGETEKLYVLGSGNTSYLTKQAKLFADGAIFSQNMQLRDGYLDGHKGSWMMDPDLFAKVFRKYWEAGWQIHVHQNGDAGLDMLLDSLEDNMRRTPRYDHRTVVVHFGFSAKDQVERIKRLGAIVSANPYYVTALADKYSESGVGPQRANEMVRLGDIERAGLHYSLHDDMPMAPSQPLLLMHAAVNRTTFSGRVAGPDQRISREGALRAVTIEAAHSLRLEKKMGSIEPGKLANFTVLDENPVTVAPDKIKEIRIWGTVYKGRVAPVPRTVAGQRTAIGPIDPWLPSDAAQAVAAGEVDADGGAHHTGCELNRFLVAAVDPLPARRADAPGTD